MILDRRLASVRDVPNSPLLTINIKAQRLYLNMAAVRMLVGDASAVYFRINLEGSSVYFIEGKDPNAFEMRLIRHTKCCMMNCKAMVLLLQKHLKLSDDGVYRFNMHPAIERTLGGYKQYPLVIQSNL